MTDPERVTFLLQPAGAAYLTGLIPEEGDREGLIVSALAQYADPRLAAAFVLDTLCQAARVAATVTSAQTKSITLGPIKLEKVVNSGSAEVARADGFCAQAAQLRREVRRSRSASVQLASPTFVRRSPLAVVDDALDGL